MKTLGQISFLLVNFFIFLNGVNEVDDEVYKGVVENVNDNDSEKQKSKVRISFQLELN